MIAGVSDDAKVAAASQLDHPARIGRDLVPPTDGAHLVGQTGEPARAGLAGCLRQAYALKAPTSGNLQMPGVFKTQVVATRLVLRAKRAKSGHRMGIVVYQR